MKFSQRDEEEVILRLAGANCSGFFLDIGAYDGVTFSNTRALALRGWSGLCVEPSPVPLWRVASLYRTSDKVRVLGAAVVPGDPGIETMQMTEDALSTSDPNNLRVWKNYVKDFTPILTRTVSVGEVLALCPDQIDMVNVDTEGTSEPVFYRILEAGKRPKIAVVEYDRMYNRVVQRAAEFGYEAIHRTLENAILFHKGTA